MVRIADAGFKVKSRNLWKNPDNYYGQNVFVGRSWDQSGGFGDIVDLTIPSFSLFGIPIPAISLGRTGARFDYTTSGKLGLQCYAGAFGGDFSANYDANLTYRYPLYIKSNDTLKVTVLYRTIPSAHFDTTTPQYRAGIDLVTELKGRVGGEAAFLGANLFNNPTIVDGSAGGSKSLISQSDLTESSLPGLLGKFTPFGMSLSVPDTSTHGIYDQGGLTLTGTKYSPFVSFDTTLLGLITAIAGGSTDVLDFTNQDFSYHSDGFSLDASWKIAAFEARNSYGFKQTVTLTDNPTVVITAKDDQGKIQSLSHTFSKAGDAYTYEFKMPASGVLVLHTDVSHAPQLVNRIDTGVSGSIGFTPFALSFNAGIGQGPYAKSIGFTGAVDPQNKDFGSSTIQEVASETTKFGANDINASAPRDITVNPVDDTKPSPVAMWPGSQATPVDGQAPYAQLPAYNDYSRGSGDIDRFPAYDLSLVPLQGSVFSGVSPSDLRQMQATVTGWDGQPLSSLSSQTQANFVVYEKSPLSINLRVPAALLRPGRHMLSVAVSAAFQGNVKKMAYDVPVIVRVPVPTFQTQVWNNIQFSDNPNAHFTNRFYRTTNGGTFFIKVNHALLETEVVLDDKIVLPSTKYVQLGSGGGPMTVETDVNQNYSDADELQYYTSGNAIMSLNLSTELIKALSGSVHTVRLRTKDVKGTALNQDVDSATDTYTLSPLPETSLDVPDTRFYFWVNRPTIDSTSFDRTATDPQKDDTVRLVVKGTEFTPTATAALKIANVSYSLPVNFDSDTQISADVPSDVLLALQKSGYQGTLTVSTPSMRIPNPTLDTPLLGGGSASKAVTFNPLVPSVDTVTPSAPLRGQAVTLKVTGHGFTSSGVTAGSSEVVIESTILPTSSVRFERIGRNLTSFEADVPASLLSQAGRKRLRVVNHAPDGWDLIGHLDFTVSNAKPVISTSAPLTVTVNDVDTPTLSLSGGLFYNDTTALVDSVKASVRANGFNALSVTLPASKTNQPSTKLSVLNPAPGGGQSAEVPVTILEGNMSKLSFSGGLTSYDMRTRTFRQQVTMTYNGNRTLRGKMAVDFTDLPAGVSVVGLPQFTASDLLKGGTVTFTVNFQRSGTAPITWTAKARPF